MKKIIITTLCSTALLATLTTPIIIKEPTYIEGTNITKLEAKLDWKKTDELKIVCKEKPNDQETTYKFINIETVKNGKEEENYFVFQRNQDTEIKEILKIINTDTKLPKNTDTEIYELKGYNETTNQLIFQKYEKKGFQKIKDKSI